MQRLPATAELTIVAMLFALLVGLPAGIISAWRRGSAFDHASVVAALTGVSMPIFWLGLMLAWLFGVQLKLLPFSARLDTGARFTPITNFLLVDAVLRGDWPILGQTLRHLLLPAVALGTVPMAIVMRMTRGAMTEVLHQDYRPYGAGEGLARPGGDRDTCVPERAATGRHDRRAAGRHVVERGDPDRDDLLLARYWPLGVRVDSVPRLPGGPEHDVGDRGYLRGDEFAGRSELRVARPARALLSSEPMSTTIARAAPGGPARDTSAVAMPIGPTTSIRSPLRDSLRRFLGNSSAVVGLVIVAAFVLMAIFAQWITPYGADQQLLTDRLKAPSAQHFFGTDDLGRDVLTGSSLARRSRCASACSRLACRCWSAACWG